MARIRNVRESSSLTGQFAAVDEILTGRENLVLMAGLRHLAGTARIAADLLGRFGLTDAADRRVATYSGGKRRRLGIAMSLVGSPPVIFLDEPTTGPDPQSRIEVWSSVKELVSGALLIAPFRAQVLASHLLEVTRLPVMPSAADAPIHEDIPCTTAYEIPGYQILAHMGLTWGVLVRSVGFTKGFAGGLRAMQAGEVPQYTEVVDQARRQALGRLIAHAKSIGGNAVIGVRFDSSDVGGTEVGLSEIIAYGSAVVIAPIDQPS